MAKHRESTVGVRSRAWYLTPSLKFTNTGPCCHSSKNVGILTQSVLQCGLYKSYGQDSCIRQGFSRSRHLTAKALDRHRVCLKWICILFAPKSEKLHYDLWQLRRAITPAPLKIRARCLHKNGGSRGRAIEWCPLNLPLIDPCCYGNQPPLFENKIGNN